MDYAEHRSVDSKIGELEARLAELPTENVVERMGLEARLETARAAVAGFRKHRSSYKARLTLRQPPVVREEPQPDESDLAMTVDELSAQIALSEDSRRQFKQDITNADALAAEMAAFANSEGGTIFLGVGDDGSVPGLSRGDVTRLNQLIGNTAPQHVRSPLTVQTENVGIGRDRVVIVLTIPKGQDKPYFDRNGVIWLRNGADKRRVNSKEELRRLFQSVDQFHADELPTKAGIDKLDKLRFRDFLRDVYQQSYPDSPDELLKLLQNMNLAAEDGKLNLAGVLG